MANYPQLSWKQVTDPVVQFTYDSASLMIADRINQKKDYIYRVGDVLYQYLKNDTSGSQSEILTGDYFPFAGATVPLTKGFNRSGGNEFELDFEPIHEPEVYLNSVKIQNADGMAFSTSGTTITINWDLIDGDYLEAKYYKKPEFVTGIGTAEAQSRIDNTLTLQKDQNGGISANDTSILNLESVDDFATANRLDRTRFYVEGERGGLFDYFPSSEGLTVDNGIIFATTDGGFAVRNYNSVVEDSWFITNANYDPSNESSGDNDGDILTSLLNAVPEGSTINLRKDSNYRIDTPIQINNKSVNLNLNGSTLWQTSNTQIIRIGHDLEWSENVASATIQNENFGGSGGVSYDYLRIEIDSIPEGTKRGDIVKFTSEDRIIGTIAESGTTKARYGQLFPIIEVSEPYIYVSIPIDFEQYLTGLRVHKLQNKPVSILNGYVSTIDTDNGWGTGVIFVQDACFFHASKVNSRKSWGNVFDLRGLYMPKIQDCFFQNGETLSGTRVGYGIRDYACHYAQYSGIRASNMRHAIASNQATVSDSDTDQIWRYGRNYRAKVFDCIGVSCNNGGFDTHAGAYGWNFDNCHSYDVYPGPSSVGAAWTIRGLYITLNNCSGAGRSGITVSEQYPFGTRYITINNSRFEGETAYRGDISDGGNLADDVVFNNCILAGTEAGLTNLTNTQVVFNDCTFIQKLESGNPRFLNLFNSNVKSERCKFLYPNGSGALRLIFINSSTCAVELNDCQLDTNDSAWNRLISASTFTHSTYIRDLKTNKPITQIFDADTNGDIQYNYDLINNSGNTGSRNISQNLSTFSVLEIGKLLDKAVDVRASLSGNETITAIDDGIIIGQILRITNTAGAFTLTVPHGGNIDLNSEANKVIQPKNGMIELFWTGSVWEERLNRADLLPATTSSDANYSVPAYADFIVLNSTLTADRTLVLRTASSFKNKTLTIINKNTGSFFWRCSPAITLPDESTTIPIDNQSVYTLLSDGSVWRVISKI